MSDLPRSRATAVQALIEKVLQRIESGRKGSIGSIDNTYMPQIGVDEVLRWRSELAALLLREGQEPPRRCDCGRELTTCVSCAVEDYQAAHPDCHDCCVSFTPTGLREGPPAPHGHAGEPQEGMPDHCENCRAEMPVTTVHLCHACLPSAPREHAGDAPATEPDDATLLEGISTFYNGCDFTLRFEGSRIFLRYGCYGVHVNLAQGARRALMEWLGVNGTERELTRMSPEIILALKRRTPCERCGGFTFTESLAASQAVTAPRDVKRPRIVCLCGSTRFIDQFATATWELELQGDIVLGCTLLPMWFCGARDHFAEQQGVKVQRDDHHKQKIDLADEVLVLDIGGYIGESTRSEIAYAKSLGKPVNYVSQNAALLSRILPLAAHGAVPPQEQK